MPTFDRRSFLRSAAAGSAAWLLPSARLPRRAEAAGAIPPRFIILYTNHGSLPQHWLTNPAGGSPTEASWDLGEYTMPLAPYKSDLIALSGIDMKSVSMVPLVGGDAHMQMQCHSLTSAQQATQELGGGISIDQFVVNGLKAANGGAHPTMLPSLHLSIADRGPGPFGWGHPFYYGPSQAVPQERVPGTAFKKLFPNGAPASSSSPQPAAPDAAIAQRKLMLELAAGEFTAVGNRLGKQEKTKLDAHASFLSDLRKRIDVTTPGGTTRGCNVPSGTTFTSGSNYWAAGYDQHPRLAQLALACDLTRVVTIHTDEVPDSISGYTGGMLGTQNSHDLVHQTDRNNGALKGNAQGMNVMRTYHRTYATLFANLIKLLKDTPESDGKTLLDHTVVLWCGEIAEGGHGGNNLRWMLAGSCGGAFKTGRLLLWGSYDRSEFMNNAASPSHADLFVSIANAMGVNATSFGFAGACKGPIDRLKG